MMSWIDGKSPTTHIILAISTLLCYYNCLQCGFVFDDMSAIRDNRDLRPETPITNLFWNDFWGTPIHKEHSHKSYRPLCVLTFRMNYFLHGLHPLGYHLVNLLLHIIVCVLFFRLCCLFLSPTPSFVGALLFAVHPIHTEAVTGVVGRAETLSSVFFLLAFLAYVECINYKGTDWLQLAKCVVFMFIATLCKEQGITVVAVCFTYEVFVIQGHTHREGLIRLSVLLASAVSLLFERVRIMGAQLPIFTKFDNPAVMANSPTRQLTLNYLLPVNAWLLLYPCNLCCDWTMGTISLITTLSDHRNLATLVLYLSLGMLLWKAFVSEGGHIIIMALSLLGFPFLPASNLFFPVGFVIAERIMYLPSMGFCLLVAYGWHNILTRNPTVQPAWRYIAVGSMIFLVLIHGVKTIFRNFDWESEYSLFMAGLKVNQRNAKLYNNVGHALEAQGKFKDALFYFSKAAEVQPDDLGAHMNVGRTHTNLHLYDDAEKAFWKAKQLLPRPKPGEQYQARIAPSHLNVFLNLANLIARNKTRLEEADALYRQAIGMRSDYVQAYINRGDILLKLNRTEEAQEVYETALQYDKTNPDIYYNLGVVCLELGKTSQALSFFDQALDLDPKHEQALMNSAILIQETGIPHLRSIAYERLQKLLSMGKGSERVFFHLGMLAMDEKSTSKAQDFFKEAIRLRSDFKSALFNLALLLSDLKRPLEAMPYLKQLLVHHPNHTKGLILLGDIHINYLKDADSAEICYKRILEQDPNNIQALHNLCVVYVEQGHIFEAEKCLLKAHSLAPLEEYIQRHLKIVRNRILKFQNLHRDGEVNSPKFMVTEQPSSDFRTHFTEDLKSAVNKHNLPTR